MNNYQIEDFIEDLGHQTTEFVEKNFQEVSAESLGLDPRAGRMLWVSEGAVAVKGPARNLEYYGGFEYVDDKRSVGEWTFYMIEEDREGGGRVRGHLSRIFPNLKPMYEEEEE